MLEDDFTDVCSKALRGLSIDPLQLTGTTQLSATEILSFFDGNFDTDLAFSIAKPLQIDGEALARLPDYIPFASLPEGVTQFVTSFGHLGVNSWLINAGGQKILFDAGNDSSQLMEALEEHLPLDAVFITHEHPDHLMALQEIRSKGTKVYGPVRDLISPDIPLSHESKVELGDLTITALDGSGHCADSLMYHIEGLSDPLCVVGDTVFAGSIGGCQTVDSYDYALRNIKRNLLLLDVTTVLLPGHGPATTLGSEHMSNPFIAAMLR